MKYNNPWVEYWNKDNIWSRSTFWRRQMEVFVRLTADVMDYNANDKVLDFGCGSGNFAEITADKIGSILCADTREPSGTSWACETNPLMATMPAQIRPE